MVSALRAALLIATAVLLLFALLPSEAMANDGGSSLPGPTWAWIGAAVVQGIISLVVGAGTVLLRESIITERASRQRLEDRLSDTRESYATQSQLTKAQADMAKANAALLTDVRREIDTRLKPIERDVAELAKRQEKLGQDVTTVMGQNQRILDLLDPKGAGR